MRAGIGTNAGHSIYLDDTGAARTRQLPLGFIHPGTAVAIGSLSCSDTKTANSKPAGSANADVKKGVAPVADPEIAVIEMENPVYGTIKIELNDPNAVVKAQFATAVPMFAVNIALIYFLAF